jgi:hypothetical protein
VLSKIQAVLPITLDPDIDDIDLDGLATAHAAGRTSATATVGPTRPIVLESTRVV